MKERLLALKPALDADPEFALAARMWTGDVTFVSDGDAVRVSLHDGRIGAIEPAQPDATSMIRIAGPRDGWDEMLKPLPRPFYQDLFGAATHHGFTIGGKIEDVGPYYPALRRIIELMRASTPD